MKSSTLAAIILLGVSVNQARASDGSGPDYASQARSISTTSCSLPRLHRLVRPGQHWRLHLADDDSSPLSFVSTVWANHPG
ncbi:MAG: hypothetical protein R3F11_27800 [Verrucomicrobiales bacterium]